MSVSVNDMADEIMKNLNDYRNLTIGKMEKAVRETAGEVKKEIGQNAPKRTGRYAKSWRIKKTGYSSSTGVTYVVYSDDYRLTHLLEHGHATRNGGRTRAIPHIAPAAKHGEAILENKIKEALNG